MPTAEDVIREAASQVGFIEGPRNDNPYGRWYGLPHQPYCAMGVCWCHDRVGSSHMVNFSTSKGYAYTPSGAEGFKKRGQWGTTPRLGAHVFFRFSGNRIHHVGLVTGWGNGWIETIEFNTSRGSAGSQRDGGGCWRRRRSLSGVVGYGYPAYDAQPAPRPTPPAPGKPAFPGTMRLRSQGEGVKQLQRRLNDHSPPERDIAVDGDFGKMTDARVRQFQAAKGLGVDGIVGRMTWEELWK